MRRKESMISMSTDMTVVNVVSILASHKYSAGFYQNTQNSGLELLNRTDDILLVPSDRMWGKQL